ncbi:hypothetical protein [Rhodoluna sp.]|uniref:hypothetical protein n=1 Tax=Rhodoluna sp. TaxID=1969481 RepID=UPI0025F16467|nr:hypothetical protein [Rhodoluna sp.]
MTKKTKAEEVVEGPYVVEEAKAKRALPSWIKSRAAKITAVSVAGALLLGGAFVAGAAVGHEINDPRGGFAAQFGDRDGDHDRGVFNNAPRPPHGPGDGDGFQPPANPTAPDASTTNP